MDALTFLYFALGGVAIVVGVFVVVVLIQLIRILKDVADATDDVKDMVADVNKNFSRITDKVVYTTEQILEYVIKPIYLTQNVIEKIKPILDFLQKRNDVVKENQDEGEVKKKSRRGRGKK